MGDDRTAPDAGGNPSESVTSDQSRDPVMGLLSQHVPLSLLLDLSSPAGPDSEHILEAEGAPEVAWWEPVPPSRSTAVERRNA